MSFSNIKDHEKRDAMVKDYIATIHRVQQRSENEKLGSLAQRALLEETYRPVVRSQQQASKEIVKGLLPIKDEVVNLRQSLEAGPSSSKKRRGETDPVGEAVQEFMLRNKMQDPTLDRTFGIRFTMPGGYVIGNTPVRFKGNDIIIGGYNYNGTAGLWSLLTDTLEAQIDRVGPSNADYDSYKEILQMTNVLHNKSDPRSKKPRSSKSWKWKAVLEPIWQLIKEEEGRAEEEEREEGEEESEVEKEEGEDESEEEEEKRKKGEGFTEKEWEEMNKQALRRKAKRKEMGRLKMMNPFLFRMRYPNYIDGGFESGYYGEGVEESIEKLKKGEGLFLKRNGKGLYLAHRDGGFESEYKGAGEESTARERMWDRRAYLYDLLEMYDKVNHKGLTDLLKDIQRVKGESYWKDR